MGSLTLEGEERVQKRQKAVRVRFPRTFLEAPHVNIVAKLGSVPRRLSAEHCTKRGFHVRVNNIPLVEQDYTLEWTATGDVEPRFISVAKSAIAIVAAFGAVLGAYAALVELRAVPNYFVGSQEETQ